MKSRWRSFIAVLAAIGGVLANAQAQDSTKTTVMTKTRAEILVPRPHLKPVKSLVPDAKDALDTLETQSPGVKIVLFSDNTWKYYRDPADIMSGEMFNTFWSNEFPNPYRVALEDLPEKISLWLVDSLGGYRCPDQTKVYSPFGYRHRRRHQGVDLPLHTGDSVYAAFAGKVRVSKYYRGYGNLVILRHENGLETFYGHLSKRFAAADQWVEAGDVIGLGGSTGRSTGAHLHFETRYQGYAFDPQWLIDFQTGELRHRLFVLKRKYLSATSKYVPESDDEEWEINLGDAKDYAVADSLAAVRKLEEEKAAAERAAAKYYKIRSGDTLSVIARRNGTTISAICKLNPGMTTRTTLKIGKSIRVK